VIFKTNGEYNGENRLKSTEDQMARKYFFKKTNKELW